MAAAIRTLSVFAGARNIQKARLSSLKCLQTRHLTFLPHSKLQVTQHYQLLPPNLSTCLVQKTFMSYSSALAPSSHLGGSNFEWHGTNSLLLSRVLQCQPHYQQRRSVVKFSIRKGKRKTVKAVVRRFFRLRWGGWIRPKCGRAKRLWKKSSQRKQRLRQHVFCNTTQNQLLDIMVTRFWKKPKYYVDDPYEPYHKRHDIYPYRT